MKNYEIEAVITAMNKDGSIFRTARFSPAVRYELKELKKTLTQKHETLIECRNEIIQDFVSDGKAVEENGNIKFEEKYAQEITSKLNELFNVDNDITLLSAKSAEEIQNNSLTLDEDEVIELITARE